MPDILNENREAIAAICRQHQVRTLFVFGSAARSTFDPDTSDLDFQVDLGDYEPTIFRRFMALHAALSKLFHREIDLITVRSTGDDRFLDEVRHTRRAIYAVGGPRCLPPRCAALRTADPRLHARPIVRGV